MLSNLNVILLLKQYISNFLLNIDIKMNLNSNGDWVNHKNKK